METPAAAAAHQLYMNEAGASGNDGAAADAGGQTGGTEPLYIELEETHSSLKILMIATAFIALGMAAMYTRYRKEFGLPLLPQAGRFQKAGAEDHG